MRSSSIRELIALLEDAPEDRHQYFYRLVHLLYKEFLDDVPVEMQVQDLSSTLPRPPIAPEKVCRRPDRNHRFLSEYFQEHAIYTDHDFSKRFHISQRLFLEIANTLEDTNRYFQQTREASGNLAATSEQKCATAIDILACGSSTDAMDEDLLIAQSTVSEALSHFCQALTDQFGARYLRKPTLTEQRRLLELNGARGFPGMLGSVDSMNWRWQGCATAYPGQYTDKDSDPTLVLEAAVDAELWLWHVNFGHSDTLNDVKILASSELLAEETLDIAEGFSLRGIDYKRGYYLADDIYPECATLISSMKNPVTEKYKHFAQMHETTRKDTERAFRRLEKKWQVIRRPCPRWTREKAGLILTACCILHNMTLYDERVHDEPDTHWENDDDGERVANTTAGIRIGPGADVCIPAHRDVRFATQDRALQHQRLHRDLVDYVWDTRTVRRR